MIKNDGFYKMVVGYVNNFDNFNFDSLEEYIKNNYKVSDISFFDFEHKYQNVFIKEIVKYYVFIYDINDRDNNDKNLNISIFYDTKHDRFLFYYSSCSDNKHTPVLYSCKTGGVIYNLFNYICNFCNNVCVEVN